MAAGRYPDHDRGATSVDDPELRFYPGPVSPWHGFRVASTPRFRDNSTGEWKDGDSLFLDLQCVAARRRRTWPSR